MEEININDGENFPNEEIANSNEIGMLFILARNISTDHDIKVNIDIVLV